MKTKRVSFSKKLALAALIATGFVASAPSALAATYYWDVNGTAAAYSTVVGAWDGTNAFFNTDSSGGAGGTTAATVGLTNDLIIPAATTNTGTITVTGAQAVGSLTFDSAVGAVTLSGSGSIALGGTGLITVNNASNTIGNNTALVLGGTVGLTKAGSGSLTLNGNTANTFSGGLRVNGGTLVLDFANMATATDLINSGNSLTLGGGSLSLTGKSSAVTSQTFNGVTVNTGASSIVATQNGATSLDVTLGTITRNNGGVLNFTTLPTTGSIALANANDASGILGAWATVGSGTTMTYATVSGGAIASYTGGTAATANLGNVTSATTNYTFTGAQTLGGVATANTLQFTTDTATRILALGSNTLTLNGLLNTSGQTLTISGAGTIPVGSATDLVITGPNSVTISSAVTGAGKGLTYAGTGTLTLNTTVSTYTGTTTVDSGTVTLGLANVLNSGSSIVVNGGTLGTSTFNQAVAALTINGGTISSTTGTITSTATVVGNGGTISAILAGSAGVTATTGTTILNGGTTANTYTGATTINTGATLQLGSGGTGLTNVIPTASAITNNGTLIFAPGTAAATYANVITQSAGSTFILNGNPAGTPAGLTLSATTSNIGGSIILNQGRLVITALTNIGNATTPITINGTGTNGGQLWGNAAIAIANPIFINNSPGSTEGSGNLGAIRGFNGVSYTGPMTLLSGIAAVNPESGNTVTVSGLIQGAGTFYAGTVSNNRGGTVTLTGANNTYTGGTRVSGATLNANAAGVLGTGAVTLDNFSNTAFAQSVPNALTGTNSLTVNGGTATLSQTNNFIGGVTVNGGTLNANAAGALGNNFVTQTGGTVAQSVANGFQGGTVLNLSGGTTNLSFANTYTGGANISGTNVTNVTAAGGLNGVTAVSGGTLSTSVTAPGTYGNNGPIVLSGGVLTNATAGGNFQNVALNSGGVVNPGGVGTVGTGQLTINGLSTASGSALQFDLPTTVNYDSLTLGLPSSLLNPVGLLQEPATIASGTNITFGNTAPAAGTYNLINYNASGQGLAAPTLGNFNVVGLSGQSYVLGTSGGFVTLQVTGSYLGVSSNWLPTATPGPFSWNTGTNWSGGNVPRITGDSAIFNSALAGAQAVTVDGLQHVGTLTLNPSTAFAYTINQGTTGSTIFMDNGASAAQINNTTQNNVINAPLNLVSSNTNVNVAASTQLTIAGTTSGAGKLTVATGTGTLLLNGTGAWTGGTQIDSGTILISAAGGTASQLNSAGVGTTTLNGGTLNFSATTGQTTLPAGFVVNLGASGGTLNAGAGTSGTGGKVLTNAVAGFLTGSGQLTKTGGGDLQVPSPSIGFTGNVVLSNNGLIEDQSVAALGFGTTTGFNGGSVTLNGPTGANAPELVASGGIQIFNPITLAGGTLSANGNNNGIFNNTVNVTASSILRASQFQGQTVAQNFAVNTLTGSGALAVNGSTTASAIGMVTVGTISGYSGTITVGANAAIGIPSGYTGTAINVNNVTGGLGLVADGDGTSTPQTIAYTLPTNATTFIAANTTGYIVGKAGATTLFNQEANKTIAPTAALAYNNTNTLNVQAFNGYGLLLANQPALTATTTFGVGTVVSVGGVAPTAQASNVIPALTLRNLTGTGFGIAKTGASTLQLGVNAADATNTFGFAASTPTAINITGGIVSAFADQNLGAVGNGITLNNTTLAEFLALNSFATSRTITIGAATGSTIGVAGTGTTLTLNSGLAYSAVGNALTKVENGTLVLTAAATGAPTSGTTISGGVLQISNSNQLGSGTITNATAGAALQLSGGGTITQAVALNSVGVSGAVGGLTNLSGATTQSGVITINGGSLITNQDASNTFTLGAITNTTTGFNAGGAGNITISGVISGAGVVNATGPGNLRLTGANTTSGAIQALGANMILSGGGANGAGGVNIQYGGTLTLDNSGTNLNNRTSTTGLGVAFHTVSTAGGGGGTLNLIGNSGATTTETLLGMNVGRGQTTFTVTPNISTGQPANLILTATGGAFTHGAFSSATFVSSGAGLISGVGVGGTASASINTGVITTAASFQGAGTVAGQANYGILPWALVINNGGTPTLATSTVIGASGYLRNLGAGETTGDFVNYQNYNGPSSTLNGTWLTASNIINTTNTAGLFVGQSVSSATGTGLPAGAFITAITPGVSITINANTSAAQTTAAGLTYSTTGTNLNLTTASTGLGGTVGQAGTLTQTINSLTLGTGGTLTQPNTNTVLTIANNALGGAILSTDSAATISGGQITGGGQELIVHTPSNLTISSNIIGGGGGANGGLTKADGGTLTLGGTAFYGGQTVVNAGTLSLNAGNNTIQFANYMNLGTGAALNLNANNQIVTDLFSDAAGASGLGTVGGNSSVLGSGVLTLKRDNTARTYTGAIGGSLSLVVSGLNTWTLTQPQTYTGPTLINTAGGTVTLQNNASLLNTSALTINRSTLALDNTGSADVPNRLPTGLGISLGGGTLSYLGRAQFTSTETLGVVTASEGANTINITNNTTGISSAQLTLTGINRTAGSTVNFTNTNGTLGTIGSNPMIMITGQAQTTASGATSLLGGGYTVNGNDFAAYNPTYGVGALGTTGFAGYSPLLLNNAAATDNVSNATSTGVAIGSMSVNSLRASATVNVIQTPGTTLTLNSGGLMAAGGTLNIGSIFVNGTTFTNVTNQGNLTSGGPELFLLGNSGSGTVNSAITGSGMALVKSGSNTWTINGTNTYTGGTYVDQGTLTLGNGGNVTLGQSTLGTGGIFLNGGTLTQTAGSIIPSQAVTISGSSTLNTTSDLVTAATSVTALGSNIISVPNGALGVNGIHVGDLVSGTGIPGNQFVTAVNPANNTVTITSGAGVLPGTVALTFRSLSNTLSSVTFNNNGGSNPTLSNTGLLKISSGTIVASSNNVGGGTASVNTLTGGNVDLNNVASPTITVNPITFNSQNLAPYQPTLIINSALQNANNAVSVTGGGNLQLGGASIFSGGVTLASGTSITLGASSTNAASGLPLSGPLGTGTLTIGTNSTLLHDGTSRTVGNNVVVSGNFNFDAPSTTAASLTLGANTSTITLPASAATTINVNAPNMTGAFGGSVIGSGSSIIKTGMGTLQLSNGIGGNSTFNGGITINGGTLLATGVGAGSAALGTGTVTINNGILQLKHSGQSNNGTVTFGNNVQIGTTQANAYIDINNNGANSGNTIAMGQLGYSGFVGGSAAPTTILNVTGGNNYKISFNGFSGGANAITTATSSPTFNVGAGLTTILPGGFNVATNLPVNIGPGTLMYSGSNIGAVAASPITGTVAVAPFAAQSNTPLGTGAITLNTGATIQISPLYSSSVSTTGYTSGGATAKYYFTGSGNITTASNYGIAPNSTLTGVGLNDGNLRQSPFGVNNNGAATNSMVVYQAMLNITNAGTYYFGSGTDDSVQITIDGQSIVAFNGGQALNQLGIQGANLSAGAHQIVVREHNSGGGGGSYVFYTGPDTASNGLTGTTPTNNLQSIQLSALSYATNYTAANNYQNAAILNNSINVADAASATIDGLGTDFNYAIPSLTLGNGSTLNVVNGTGTAFGSNGNGAFVVTGTTTLGTTATLSPTTGTLVLAGGIVDSGNGLTKAGSGNVIIQSVSGATAGTNTFTGPFNINAGFVQLSDPFNNGVVLTNGTTTIGVATTTPATLDLNGVTVATTGNIILNGGAGPAGKTSNTPAGLYNSSAATASLPAGGTLSIGAATATVNPSVGGFGDIIINGTIQDGAAGTWNKVGPNNLILNGNNSFTGTLNLTAGKVVIGNASALGTNAGSTIVNGGATLDLNGFSVAENITLNGAGMTLVGAPNALGSLINSSASPATVTGTVSLGSGSSIGGPNLGAGNGSITISGSIALAQQLTKVGGNNLTLTATAGAETFIDVQAGSLTLSGNGAIASSNNANLLRQNTTMTLDNTSTAVSQRMGNHGLWLSGNLVITGNNTTAVAETISQGGNNFALGTTFANGYGGATVTLNAASTPGVAVSVASTSTSIFARATGTTALLRGDALGQAVTGTSNTANIFGSTTSLGLSTNNGQAVGQAGVWNAPNAMVYPWAVADINAAGLGGGFAGYNGYTAGGPGTGAMGGTTGALQANVYGVSPISSNANNAFAAAPTLTTMNANIPNNTANATITVASTAGLQVGQLVVGTNIPANAVIQSITNATSFVITGTTGNVGATNNQQIVIYANPTQTLTGFTTVAGTTQTVPSTANMYAGQLVTGVTGTGTSSGFIPAGTTIASITNGTTIVLSAAATAGTGNLVFGLPGYANISSAGATNTFGTAGVSGVGVAQEINSLTLNNPGVGSTTTINMGLQVDSGGVLAIGADGAPGTTPYVINSGANGGVLTGTNTLNREMIFHTVGTGTTLTVNAPIFSNGSGLTKADGGMLVLGTRNFYTGDTVINGGTLQLAGGQNTIFKVFTTAASPGNTAAAINGQNLTVNSGGTLDLNGTTQAFANLRSGSGTQLAGGTISNSNAGPATLAVALNGNQTWAGNISNGQTFSSVNGSNAVVLAGSASGGALNFVRDGNNTLTINSPQTLSGSVTVTGGATTLTDLGTFQNASAVNVVRSALIWNDTGVQAISNRLSSSAPITLTGGGLQILGRAGTGSTPVDAISLGTLNLGIGESSVIISTIGQGGATSVTFAGIGSRAVGSTVNFGNATFAPGANPYYYFTSAPTLTNGIIGAWATVNSLTSSTGGTNLAFATYDPATGVRGLQYQPNATYGSGVNTGLTGNATIPAPLGVATTTALNSLTIYNGTTLSFTNFNDTLLVQSGGILASSANDKAIGSTAVPGTITAGSISNGGSATDNDLYIHNSQNTLTINSRIADNGKSGGMNVIIDGMSLANSQAVTLTNANTYGGATYLSGTNLNLNSLLGPAIPGNIILSGGNSSAADSLVDTNTQLVWQQPNQIASTASITMNGATRLNMGSAVFTSGGVPVAGVPNSQTIANLTINNDGGSNSLNGPTIFTGAGSLTVSGTLTASASQSATIATFNGFLALTGNTGGGGTSSLVVNPNTYVPNQIVLDLNGNIAATNGITMTGGGFVGIGAQSQNLVGTAFNLNAGGLAFSASTGTNPSLLGSAVAMGANTTIDSRGLSGTVGPISSASSSAVLMNGVQGTAGTITTGLNDYTSTATATFAGVISSPYPTGLLNITKIGTGQWELTGNSQATTSGTLTVSGGTVLVDPAVGGVNFQTNTLNTGGTITLDNTATAQNNRLGGAFYTTANTLAPTIRSINMQGGNLTIIGNSSTPITENLGAITSLQGGGIITINAAGTAGVNSTLQSIPGQGAQTSLLIRGTGLGNTAGANVASVVFATAGAAGTAPGLTTLGGTGANNTLTRGIRSDILVDSSATGNGQGFMVIDSVTGLVRPLGFGTGITFASELSPTFITTTATNTNVSLSTVAFGSATANQLAAGNFAASYANNAGSLTLQSGGGINQAIVATNPFGANGGFLTVTNNSTGGFLNLAGSNSITTGQIVYGTVTSDYHVLAGSTLTLNSSFSGSTGGFTKADGGTLILNRAYTSNNAQLVTINGGTLQFGTGSGSNPSALGSTTYSTNPLYVYINAGGVPSAENLAINNGTLDLNGNNQLVGTLTSQNPLPFGGGTAASPNIIITNTNATAATFSTNAANSVFSGSIQGNLNLDKSGNTTMTLSSPQTYTGTTTIRGGNITLRDSATLASTSINANFAQLIIDNTGLSDINARISSSATVTLNGGAIRVNQTSSQYNQTFGTVNLNSGSNVFVANQYNNNTNSSTGTFTISNLVVNNGSTLLYSTQGSGGFNASQNHLYLNNVNGVPYSAANMVNGIIGAQYLTNTVGGNSFNWATYSNLAGVTNPNTNGTANYGALGGGAATNANVTATTQSVAGQTLNTLRIGDPAAGTTLGMNGSLDQLVLAGGGILVSNNANQAIAIQGGSITAGAANTPSTLYLQVGTQNTTTINSPFVNNGATLSATTGAWSGGTGALSLTRSTGNMTVTLNPIQVESLTTAQLPASSTTITVPNATGLFVGMAVSGTGITAGSTITGIAGNVLTLSAATSATANTATAQITFAPPASAATSSTTQGTTTVTTAANAFATNFTPVAGMTVGGANIPGGTTLVSFTGTNATGFTFTLSQPSLATAATNVITVGALSNAYTGTTTINSSLDQAVGGTTNLSGQSGAVLIPGNLTINGGATVAMVTNQGQIASTSAVTINGSGVLTLVGSNRFSTTLTINNTGGNAAPTVNVGTLLDYSSGSAISANNDNSGFTPVITGGTVNFSNATGTTINVTGASVNDLSIASQITTNAIGTTTSNGAGAVLTKTGSGSLILPNANAASLTWALNGGSIFVGNATSLGTNATAGALSFSGNVGLASSNTSNPTTIALPTVFSAPTNLTLGNGFSGSTLTLSGAMNLNGQAPTFTVPTAWQTNTITGQITGAGGFTKAGPGLLTLTPGTASTFTGPITVTGGMITMGNANAFGGAGNNGADYTVGTTGAINMNGAALSIGSLAGGGIMMNSGAVQALTIGTGSNATNANFSGSLVAATAANLSLVKTGTNNQTLSGQSYYTGVTTVSGGTLTLANGATANPTNTAGITTAAQIPTLADTAITVGAGANLQISSVGANVLTQSTVSVPGTVLAGGVTMNNVTIGNNTTVGSTAALTLSTGTSAFAFNPANTSLTQFNVIGGASTLTGLTTSVSGASLAFNIGASGADLINLGGKASITAGTNISLNVIGSPTSLPLGVIPLIEAVGAGFTGAGTNNFNLATPTIALSGPWGSKTYNLTLAGVQNTTTQTALLVSAVAPANAYWSGAVNANWNTGIPSGVTNWRTDATSNVDTQAVPDSNTNVFFNTTTPVAANLGTALGTTFAINSLNFNGVGTGAGTPTSITDINALTINAAAVNGNTLGNGITVANTSAAVTIAAPVVLGASQSWTNNSSNLLTVSGGVSGANQNLTVGGTGSTTISGAITTAAGTLTKENAGTLTLTGVNTYSGTTTINGGVLQLGNGTSGNDGTIANSLSIVNNANLTYNRFGSVSYSGVISGSGTVTKLGAGTQTLTGTNTYIGATTVSNGTLIVGVAGVGSLGATTTTVGSGATLGGSGSIGGAVTVQSGGILAPGNSPGTLTFNNGLTLAAGSIFNWENNTINTLGVASTNWDQAAVTGGSTTISSTPTTGAKLQLQFTNAGTDFSNSFWDTNRTYASFVNGGISAGNLFDTSNISIFINGVQQGSGNAIAGQGSFLTVVNGSNLDLVWTATITTSATTYNIATAPAALNILKGGNLTATSTITNAGTGTADTLNYSALGGTSTLPSIATATAPGSGGPLAQGASGPAQAFTVNGIAYGSTTVTGSATATNATIGGPAIPGTLGTISVVVGEASLSTLGNTSVYGNAPTLATNATNIVYSAANWESRTNGLTASGGGPASVNTVASVLMYNNTTGGATETVGMQWRTRTTAEANPAQPNAVLSDVVNLTGMYSGSETTGTGTGAFVMQMSYLQSTLDAYTLNETAIALSGELRLGWRDPSDSNWKTATLGDVGGTSTFVGVTDWNSYYLLNSAVDDGTDLNLFLGRYGVDPSGAGGGVVWAVVNHNSQFAVIPEPSTLVLGGLTLLGFAGVGLRRRRLAKQQA